MKYNCTVINHSNSTQNFFFFQQQSTYRVAGEQYSTSLGTGKLASHSSSGSQLSFSVGSEIYAGAQKPRCNRLSLIPELSSGDDNTNRFEYQAVQRVNLTGEMNSSNLTVDPFGLSPAQTAPDIEPNRFGIVIPAFMPFPHRIECGVAVDIYDNSLILSNFVDAPPNQIVECSPYPTFYVAVGNPPAGALINYGASMKIAAKCDYLSGIDTIIVVYDINGKFLTTPSC